MHGEVWIEEGWVGRGRYMKRGVEEVCFGAPAALAAAFSQQVRVGHCEQARGRAARELKSDALLSLLELAGCGRGKGCQY